MKQVKVNLSERQVVWLERSSKSLGISVSELIRRHLDTVIEQQMAAVTY